MNESIFPIAAGYLLGAAVAPAKAEATVNCIAGLWQVDMPVPYDPTKHIVLSNITGVATTDNLQTEVSPAGTGFQIQAFRGTTTVAAANESMHFTVHKLPAAR